MRTEAAKLYRAFGRLRDRHVDMTLQQAMVFLYVAAHPGIAQRELFKALEVSDSAASRNLALLSDIGNRGLPGLDIVTMKVNPIDRRERLLDLTAKGKRLLADIMEDLK